MKSSQFPFIFGLLFTGGLCLKLLPANETDSSLFRYLKELHLPGPLAFPKGRPIKIAVIDDAFRLDHRDLRGFWAKNKNDIPDNGLDDDGNGYVDDTEGWDVSDHDNDVRPPANRFLSESHGTHNAGIIASIVKAVTPDSFEVPVQIIPVKCLSDQSETTLMKDAYQGIAYAIAAGADVIICSWGGGVFTNADKAWLQKAESKGILVVASAGNFSTEQPQYPAAYPGVIAVAALDSTGRKLPSSNYGEDIAVSAPGQAIYSPDAISDTSRSEFEGTSAAAPMVAALIALKMRLDPGLSPHEILWLLQNSADPIDSANPQYAGKLGAGKINAERFLRSDVDRASRPGEFVLRNPKGAILFRKKSGSLWKRLLLANAADHYEWHLQPSGIFPGLQFNFHSRQKDQSLLRFIPDAPTAEGISYRLNSVPDSLFVPGSGVRIEFTPAHLNRAYHWELEFQAALTDSGKLYCRDTKHLDVPNGSFEDGSGPHFYSAYSDCKWLITAPATRVVKLEFTQFETEAKRDWVYVFDGAGTNSRILGLFSGPDLPPIVASTQNKMLVWFVTDGKNQGQGWQAHYTFEAP